jgi:hypothetical protein
MIMISLLETGFIAPRIIKSRDVTIQQKDRAPVVSAKTYSWCPARLSVANRKSSMNWRKDHWIFSGRLGSRYHTEP